MLFQVIFRAVSSPCSSRFIPKPLLSGAVEAEVEEAIEVLVEEELGMNPTFGEGPHFPQPFRCCLFWGRPFRSVRPFGFVASLGGVLFAFCLFWSAGRGWLVLKGRLASFFCLFSYDFWSD